MARKKKEVKHYQIIDEKVVMEEKDIANLTESEHVEIAFYVKTLGYELVYIEPEPKKKNYFTVEKAEKYLKKDKEGLNKFKAFKKNADKLTAEYKDIKKTSEDDAKIKEAQKKMITAQREAFIEQKNWFKDTYGIEEYDKVRKEY
jgi:hypothetical protein